MVGEPAINSQQPSSITWGKDMGLKMTPQRRSVLIAVVGGMMGVSYLESQGVVDLSFGFPTGGLVEGVVIALTGALVGFAVLLTFRIVRDLASRSKTKVYASAPGFVTKAGWKGRYGRMIEIDHGFGIYTRYGHLRKVLVKKGQKVDFHQMIGRMGSSGRSTGPHVHYEIVVNGVPQDPLKFIHTGRHCLKRISKSIKDYVTPSSS